MPTIFNIDGWKFYFHSSEGSPREPIHVHVSHKDGKRDAKFWIEPRVELVYADNMRKSELNWIEDIVIENKELIRRRWNEYFKV